MPLNSNTPFAVLFFSILVISGSRKEPMEKPLPDAEYPTVYQ